MLQLRAGTNDGKGLTLTRRPSQLSPRTERPALSFRQFPPSSSPPPRLPSSMAKSKGAKRKITGQGAKGSGWGAAEHAAAKHAKIDGLKKKLQKKLRQRQVAAAELDGEGGEEPGAEEPGAEEEHDSGSDSDTSLTHRRSIFEHDTHHKKQQDRDRLNIALTRKTLQSLRPLLSPFDATVYSASLAKDALKQQQQTAHNSLSQVQRRIKARNLDPEKWELKGAARPASEVYDFDVNFVDVHVKALEDHKTSLARSVDLAVTRRGKFSHADSPQPMCLDFLNALRDHATECVAAKKFKEARETYKEAIALDAESDVFGFRGRLISMFLECNKPDSIRRFVEDEASTSSTGGTHRSGVVMYAYALIEYVSAHLLKEDDSDAATARAALKAALKTNLYIGLYLAFYDTFTECVEYAEEVMFCEEGGVLEAVKFGSSQQSVAAWMETEGATDWLREETITILLGARGEKESEWADWATRLGEASDDAGDKDAEKDEDDTLVGDVHMYAGMFLTAMEMVEESSVFDK